MARSLPCGAGLLKLIKLIKMKTCLIIFVSLCVFQKANTQSVNWNALEETRHIMSAGIGWDYSVSYNLGYAYHVNAKMPMLLSANFSIPSGENLLDDFKSKIGGQVVLLNKPNLKASIALHGIYRRYENTLVRLQNIGSEINGTIGYYKPKWFVAGEVGFDKAIVTHFSHSEAFKETVFEEVTDGWYEPTTGGNFHYGIHTGYSFKRSDIDFNIGMITTQDFKTTPLIPYYLMLVYHYRISM